MVAMIRATSGIVVQDTVEFCGRQIESSSTPQLLSTGSQKYNGSRKPMPKQAAVSEPPVKKRVTWSLLHARRIRIHQLAERPAEAV